MLDECVSGGDRLRGEGVANLPGMTRIWSAVVAEGGSRSRG
jgi:hypothetical protein